MVQTLQFIFSALKQLLFQDFYLFPLVACAFLLLITIIKRLEKFAL